MTVQEKNRIAAMRKAGMGYAAIAQELEISKNTVKTFCRRNNLQLKKEHEAEPVTNCCPQCGGPVHQTPGRKHKKFCSDLCRNKWWNAHPNEIQRKAMYNFVCPTCGKAFSAYGNSHRKYCSHECYIADRFGGRR